MNYMLYFENGELYPGSGFVKAVAKSVSEKGQEKRLSGSLAGYGATQREAVNDFLRRNEDKIIDLVFKEDQ